MIAITDRDRRTLLRGAAAIALLLYAGRIVPATVAWSRERQAAASALRAERVRAEVRARDASSTSALLVTARTRLAAYDSAMLDAPTYTRATAVLAALMRGAAEGAEAQLGALQLRADSSSRGVLSTVSVRTTVTGDLTALALFIQGLEAGPELLSIRELSIVRPAQDAAGSDHAGVLQGEILVEGVFRTPVAARPPVGAR